MLQRPQTLLFIAAAMLSFLVAFAPLAGYAPDFSDLPAKMKKEAEKIDAQVVVKPSGLDYTMNKPDDVNLSDKKFNEGMEKLNKELDAQVDDRNINILFHFGVAGFILLGLCSFGLIFLFKRRKLQIRFGIALFMITLLVTVGVFIASRVAVEALIHMDLLPRRTDELELVINYKYGFFMLPVMAICMLVGVIFVRRDDNLVKSLDRLR